MKIKPTGDKILVRPLPWESKTAGGLHLVEKTTHFMMGEVLDIGRGVDTLHGFDPITDIHIGDKIMYYTAQGSHFTLAGEKYVMLNYKEVHSVVID